MEINGTIIHILPEVSGTGKTGSGWRKQEYVLETKDQYPKKICFNVWGEKIDQFGIQMGEETTVSVDVESKEYNGRWFTEVKAWKVQKGNVTSAPTSPTTTTGGNFPPPPPLEMEPGDDLPF